MSDDVRGRAELLRALAVLAEPPGAAHARLGGLLGLEGRFDAASYADVFLFQLYPYASVHLGAEGMIGGDARGRVAGFWSALGRRPPAEPDHLAALVGLYASLREEAAERAGAEAVLLERSAAALLAEHLSPWAFAYLARVEGSAPEPYRGWAALLRRTLREEAARDPEPCADLPAHLASAPPLPDPREHGATAFVVGLLAPVRSGMILTRADLAGMARRLDLGLRAGERRYALEHLLAQAPERVLGALADGARACARAHEADVDWLGRIADFHAGRARSTAELLDALALAAPVGA